MDPLKVDNWKQTLTTFPSAKISELITHNGHNYLFFCSKSIIIKPIENTTEKDFVLEFEYSQDSETIANEIIAALEEEDPVENTINVRVVFN